MSTPVDQAARRVVIVGGGISGLACARAIAETRTENPRVEVLLLESSQGFGGNIATEREGEFVLDRGPDSWVTNKPEAAELARALGLGDSFISTIAENRRVYIAHEGRLHPMPEGLVLGIPTRIMPIAKTPLFSLQAKARMALEPFVPVRNFDGDEDESIGAFVERRLGREVSERLVGPLLGGIFAGDAGAISVRAAFPQLVEAEKKYGSLLRAVRAQKRASANAAAFASLQNGMGSLVDALVSDLEKRDAVRLRRGIGVRSIARTEEGQLVIELENGEHEVADVVVVATP
ncbi:MAG: protoporphyrinogen oxidase, partial [Polyangiaceae bacterium]